MTLPAGAIMRSLRVNSKQQVTDVPLGGWASGTPPVRAVECAILRWQGSTLHASNGQHTGCDEQHMHASCMGTQPARNQMQCTLILVPLAGMMARPLYLLGSRLLSAIDVTVGRPITVRRSSGSFIETSPGIKHGDLISSVRLRIPSVSRIRNINKYANSFCVKVELIEKNTLHASQKADVCFHGNESLGLGQCCKESWQALEKDSWNGIASPFETKYLDLRIRDSLTDVRLTVSVEEEFWPFRLVFLTCGLILLLVAPIVSSWVPFYYSSAMVLGIFLIVIILLFQGMKLLPTGRKSTLYIVLYGSVVGLGTVILHYFSGLVASISKELGISSQAYNPVAIFVVLGIGLMGSWLGYWGVRKMVLLEDGSVDGGTANFVKWAIYIVGSVMILQSSHDPLLAVLALLTSWIICWTVKKVHLQDLVDTWDLTLSFWRERFFHKIVYNIQSKRAVTQQSPKTEFLPKNDTAFLRSRRGSLHQASPLASKRLQGSPVPSSNGDITEQEYLSTFHKTPTRRGMSQSEWTQVTKQHTQVAIQELAASPKFTDWFAKNAERVMIVPNEHREDRSLEEVQTTAYLPQVDEGVASGRSRCWGFLF
ncbi:hypothetical protein GOP47_0004364 [Adiantum capillus-veneris]|uniref:Uncharacterized protein n=1 Tax=Adiantum capillus-veneris TaxID=13818 RepID=A0A9D4V7C5_ADICA|nr:hypothetical protein GOP47_0004364 [Adiantum capillus-veneris]